MSNKGDGEVKNQNNQPVESRREFVKKTAYIAPVILTLAAMPSFAKAASNKPTSGGTYTPPTFSNAQVQALYTWLISDPTRLARLNAAATQFNSLASDVAIKQMINTLLTTIVADLATLPAVKATLISQTLSTTNLTELAEALLAGS